MSSTFVKLSMASRQVGYLRASLNEGVVQKNTNSNLGIELSGVPTITQAAGKDEGDPVEGMIIKANQKVLISLGKFNPHKFHGVIVINPALHQLGLVGGPSLVEPDEETFIEFSYRPDKQVDLEALDWFVRLYLID